MKNISLPMVNLIPVEHIQRRQRAVWIGRWISMVVIIAFVIGIPGLYIGGSAALTDSEMMVQIEDTNQKYETNQQAIPLLRSRLGLLTAEQEVLALVENRIDWGDVFSLLTESAGNDVRFRGLHAVGGGVEGDEPIQIIVDGLAPSQTIARAYVVGLENTAVFDTVELVETRREQVDEYELIGFQIMITIQSGVQGVGGAGHGG